MIYKVGAVILNSDCEMLITRKNVPGRHTFIIPGGRREADESDGETCIREIREELGVRVTKITYLDTYREPAEFEDELLIMPVYLTEIDGTPHALSEIVEIAWISRNYKEKGIELGSTLENHVIPELILRNLIN
jgi:8-oxo-dGTP diphosphatase